ncbi:MAG: hypothetical protein ACPIOQ_49995, partial [Promethearchaeia archaeon]
SLLRFALQRLQFCLPRGESVMRLCQRPRKSVNLVLPRMSGFFSARNPTVTVPASHLQDTTLALRRHE